jgi:hypothetical protein
MSAKAKKTARARKAETKVKELGKQVHKAEMDVHRRKRMPGAIRKRAEPMNTTTAELQRNSECWVNSLFHPFDGGTHYPESCCEGTDLTTVQFENLEMSVCVPSTGTTDCVAYVFYPSMEGFISFASSATNTSAITWTRVNHPKATSLKSYAAAYRVTSYGIRVRNVTALLNRQGKLYCGRLPAASSSAATPPPADIVDLMSYSDDIKAIDLATIPEEGLEMFWLPLTTQSYVEVQEAKGAVGTHFTALGYKDVASDVLDNRLCIFAVFNKATPQQLTYDVVVNIEFIPHLEQQYLFKSEAVLGSPQAIAATMESHITSAKRQGLGEIITTGVKELGKEVWSTLKHPLKSFASRGITQLASAALSGLSGAFLLATPPRHILRRSHYYVRNLRTKRDEEKDTRSVLCSVIRPAPLAVPPLTPRLPAPTPPHDVNDWDTVPPARG